MNGRPFVFDFDGTLIDCADKQKAMAARAALEVARVEIDVGALWREKRRGADTETAYRRLGMPGGTARRAALRWRQLIESPDALAFDTILFGVPEALAAVIEAGLEPLILTARSDRTAAVEQIQSFEVLRTCTRRLVVNPGDAAAAKAAVLCEMSAVAMVGDSETDWAAASVAGIPFAAVCTGQRDETYLRRATVTCCFADITGAVDYLLARLLPCR